MVASKYIDLISLMGVERCVNTITSRNANMIENRLFSNLEKGRASIGSIVSMSDIVVSELAGDCPNRTQTA